MEKGFLLKKERDTPFTHLLLGLKDGQTVHTNEPSVVDFFTLLETFRLTFYFFHRLF